MAMTREEALVNLHKLRNLFSPALVTHKLLVDIFDTLAVDTPYRGLIQDNCDSTLPLKRVSHITHRDDCGHVTRTYVREEAYDQLLQLYESTRTERDTWQTAYESARSDLESLA